MITLTRLRHNTPFILNPDLIERIDTHVDTVVRLTSGTEYVVNETGEEIVRRTAEFRARVLALAGTIGPWTNPDRGAEATPPADASEAPAETVWAPADTVADTVADTDDDATSAHADAESADAESAAAVEEEAS
jgi:flagellar protein FlbD